LTPAIHRTKWLIGVAALQREKNVKHWSREWKIDLIVATNPEWRDLYQEIVR
jgi:putative endonuclease